MEKTKGLSWKLKLKPISGVEQCANIGPADSNYDESMNTLRYAGRAKNVRNVARINQDPKDALLKQVPTHQLGHSDVYGDPWRFRVCT